MREEKLAKKNVKVAENKANLRVVRETTAYNDIKLKDWRNYKHIENNLIPSSILQVNLEPNVENNENFKNISEEFKEAKGGTAVIFTENNNTHNLNYIKLDDTKINDIIG